MRKETEKIDWVQGIVAEMRVDMGEPRVGTFSRFAFPLIKKYFTTKTACTNCGQFVLKTEIRHGNCRRCEAERNRPNSIPGKSGNE